MKKSVLNDNVEIVVAHYSEDLEWLKPYAKNAIVYHKGNETWPRFPVKERVKLDNIWRESHTYLYHIINNYEKLADITLFLQWGIKDHKEDGRCYNDILDYVKETEKYGFSCRMLYYLKRKTWRSQIIYDWKFLDMIKKWNLVRSKYYFSEFYKNVTGEEQPCITPFFHAANFWVSKEKIYSPWINLTRVSDDWKEYYEYLLSLIPQHSNPEEGHYYERLWFSIFNIWWKKHFFHYVYKIFRCLKTWFKDRFMSKH